ncbi:MAG: RNA methyltransferase [Pseudomonadota bacterium]
MSEPVDIHSRDNPLLVRLRKLTRTPGAYRKLGAVWLEGEHLCQALRARGWPATQSLVSESAWQQTSMRELAQHAARTAVVPDALFASVSGLDSPSGIGFAIDAPEQQTLKPGLASIVLDRVQDAGNVGSILRSAAALGFSQVLALEGSASLWSPKVLRAGMGAHFALDLVEGLKPDELDALALPLLAASSHAEQSIDAAVLPWPCAWVFGHEGQGVAAPLLLRCSQTLRIPQPGGEESLNVAAAAAICLYATRRAGGRA